MESLLAQYQEEAREAGVALLSDETDFSSFCLHKEEVRGKWDPGLGGSWKKVERPVEDSGEESNCEKEGGSEAAGEKEEGKALNLEEGEVCEGEGKVRTKRKRPRGPGSRLSRKRKGKSLKSAGSNSGSRKARIADKWAQKSASYGTSSYSILSDGSRTSTGWHGLAPPPKKRKEIRKAYEDGTMVGILGRFFPVSYEG
jgi:hypothetical protein